MGTGHPMCRHHRGHDITGRSCYAGHMRPATTSHGGAAMNEQTEARLQAAVDAERVALEHAQAELDTAINELTKVRRLLPPNKHPDPPVRATLDELAATLEQRQAEAQVALAVQKTRTQAAEDALERWQDQALQDEWRAAVQAVVDALGLVAVASEQAELLRGHLEHGRDAFGLPDGLRLFTLQDMPEEDGLRVADYLAQAEAIGCDMARVHRLQPAGVG